MGVLRPFECSVSFDIRLGLVLSSVKLSRPVEVASGCCSGVGTMYSPPSCCSETRERDGDVWGGETAPSSDLEDILDVRMGEP